MTTADVRPRAARDLVPHRQPGPLRRGALDQVAAQSQEIADALDDPHDVPVAGRLEAGAHRLGRDPPDRCSTPTPTTPCIGVIAWMHTFSPAKMWIAGLDALRKPLLHLHTQANVDAAVGDHRHGLHEPQPGRARRPRVRLHPDPARRRRARPSPGTWPTRTSSRRSAPGRAPPPARRRAADPAGSPGSATTCATSPSPRATRSRPSCASASRSTPTASTTWSPSSTRSPTPSRRAGRRVRGHLRRRARAAPGGDRHESLRYGARIEARPARSSSTTAASRAFTTNFEDLGGLRQLPGLAVQRLMADGYGFGGEGDWKTSVLLRTLKVDGRRACPAAPRFMEDYTYHLVPGDEMILGAHMLEVCPSLSPPPAALEIHPLGIGGREDPVRLVFDADPGPAVVVGDDATSATVPAGGERGRRRRAPTQRCRSCRWRARSGSPEPGPRDLRRGVAARRRPAPHGHVDRRRRATASTTSPRCLGLELASSTRTPRRGRFRQELRWNSAYYRLAGNL